MRDNQHPRGWLDSEYRWLHSEPPVGIETPLGQVAGQFLLGKAIAEMYIAAQHVSQIASDAACASMEGAPYPMRLGFNQRMAQSPYKTRAL